MITPTELASKEKPLATLDAHYDIVGCDIFCDQGTSSKPVAGKVVQTKQGGDLLHIVIDKIQGEADPVLVVGCCTWRVESIPVGEHFVCDCIIIRDNQDNRDIRAQRVRLRS